MILFNGQGIYGQQFVYTPVNPSFGGNPLNGNFLISLAQIQDKLTDGANESLFGRDPLQDFEESLSRQLLSQISRQIVESTFGEEGLTEGTYDLGDFTIQIFPSTDGLNVIIFDNLTGDETSLIIPYF